MASRSRFAVACAGAQDTVEADVLRRQALGWLGGGVIGGMALAGAPVRAASLPHRQIADNAAPPLYDDDMILGKADAPVTIIEYASLTCPHCAHFAADTFPKIKKELIDTGKVRWVYRDFLWDGVALHAALLAHCVPPDQFFPIVNVLFVSQDQWSAAANPSAALSQIGRTAGLDQPTIDKCLTDDAMKKKIVTRMQEGEQRYGIKSTPTFIIAGKSYSGDKSYDEFYGLIQDLLPKA
jgi:protein-disulfide isomerase